ncbi:hypothetical protein PTMSG1_05977 [Pyrenophora teres f. maculata]|nr:hypothetical protein PTMSG1_05977 [Pyrenophora teres f. maculata]
MASPETLIGEYDNVLQGHAKLIGQLDADSKAEPSKTMKVMITRSAKSIREMVNAVGVRAVLPFQLPSPVPSKASS